MRIQPVGTKDPTPNPGDWQLQMNDLYDTHGNIAEWTWDAYAVDAYLGRLTPCEDDSVCGGESCGADGLCSGEVLDPVREAENGLMVPRVVRGGAYDSTAFECRHAARRGAIDRAHNIGFRLVRGML